MQSHLDIERALRRIRMRGRVVAQHWARAGELRPPIHQLGQAGPLLPWRGQDELDVVVKPRTHKVGQIGACQRQPHKARADLRAAHHLHMPPLEGVAHALHGQRVGQVCSGWSRQGHRGMRMLGHDLELLIKSTKYPAFG